MLQFANEAEFAEFIDIMNKKSLELILDCIINHVSKQVELDDGDVAVVELSTKGFDNVFGKKNERS